ncbi:MAG: APC family permease [Solirubrobacterales bacterium]|nr:APC family permease [Solirubrobacterales bacterium]
MAEVLSEPEPAPQGARQRLTGSTELARNALGLPQILFCIVTGSAPLAAMMFNNPLSGSGIGIAVPAAFWLAAISFTLFSVGYVEMARRKTTAGGFYSYTTYGFGRIIGLGTALGIVFAYLLFAVGVNGVTTYFANTSLNNLFGISMDWRIYGFIFLLLLFAITYFHIEIVARVLGICLLGELLILFIFSFAVLFKGGGPDGILWSALNPAGIFSGGAGVKGAAAVFGASAAGVGFFGAYWSWVGFEMAPNYAEEARNPKKMMAYATYISCIGLAVVFTFWAWMLVTAYGGSKNQWPWAVAIQYAIHPHAPASVGLPHGDYSSVYYPVAQKFVGVWLKDLFSLLIITGSFACSLAFWNTSNRYLFSMGRENILPRMFGKTHSTHKSPFVATTFVAAFCVVFTLFFATGLVGGGQRKALGIPVSSPLVALSQIGTWLPFQGNLMLFPIMALCSVAIMVYFLRTRDGFHPFKTLIAPILAAGTIVFAVYLMISNRGALMGTTTGVEFYTPFIALGVFVGGCLLGVVYHRWSRRRYEAVGKFLHEEA